MNIDLVLKRLELIKEGKGIGTISDIEASIILNELERLNNIINEKNKEIEDYSNKWCELAKAKTKSDNIINELEKWLEQEYAIVKANSIQEPNNSEWYIKWNERKNTLDKLQELKGDGSNE